jgi:high-affinity iron transporter
VQAATGLVAVVVLMLVMNWFLHRVYWTDWLSAHRRRGLHLVAADDAKRGLVVLGLVALGFTAVYREGFEVVLFLQNLRLQAGSSVVLEGVGSGSPARSRSVRSPSPPTPGCRTGGCWWRPHGCSGSCSW